MDKRLSYKAFLRRARQRRDRMIALRRAGFTYQLIGDAMGVSRERVRQVLKAEGVA